MPARPSARAPRARALPPSAPCNAAAAAAASGQRPARLSPARRPAQMITTLEPPAWETFRFLVALSCSFSCCLA